jgi:DNA helicase II / ATP-dependent DNA helicase PcrA
MSSHPRLDLSRLNPQQRAAVLQTEGPLLVLAGAGSGKTRVIAHRVVHLLDQGVNARAILAVTFTNKAASEMKERIVHLAGGGEQGASHHDASRVGAQRCRGLTVSTFHAFGVRILRKEHERLELPARFAIFDSGDQSALVKRLLRDLKVDDKRFDVPRVLSILSRRRAGGVRRDAVVGQASSDDGDALARGLDPEYELVADELLPRYELGLKAMGAVDFDDLLLLPLRLFREQRAVLEEWQKRYRYLLVDEYQDTNQTQFELLQLLAGLRRNLCVVGDDDQSIYAWRGAEVANILSFDKKFPGTVEVFLEQNYRSTDAILAAANAVIGKNPDRKGKRLWTDRGRGPNLKVVVAPDDEHEAKWVADEAIRLTFEEKIPPHEIAVLYRTNGQAKAFEESLRLAGVPYRVVGGSSIFDRKEVRDLLAYLRSALNPRDEVNLLRIVNVPARGIGDVTVAKAQELARKQKLPVWEIFRAAQSHPELEQASERLLAFVAILEKFKPLLEQKGFSAAARALTEQVGLHDEARRAALSGAAQARRVEAIEGLLHQLVAFEQRAEAAAVEKLLQRAEASALRAAAATSPAGSTSEGAPGGSREAPRPADTDPLLSLEAADEDEPFAAGLPGYLSRLALDSRDSGDDKADAVTLSTLHAAKGLEWRAVFLCGLEEGLLPHSGRGFDDGEVQLEGAINVDEERRLAYVGITRARERLVLTRCRERVKRGKGQPRTASRFLEDIPAELVDVIDVAGPQPESAKEVQQAKAKNFFAAMDALLAPKE